MAELTYRSATARALEQEMDRDPSVIVFGEDIAKPGGVFKQTAGLLEKFGPQRVFDTPISETGFTGAAMGAAMAGLRPVIEIMYADFVSVTHDIIANQIAKTPYMTDGQISLPLVIRFGNGGGLRYGAQHSQSVENWLMAVPGLKIVAPSTPRDVVGLLAAAIRDPDPVMFFEHKALLATKGEAPDGEIIDQLGTAAIRRTGTDATIVSLGAMVLKAQEAAEILQEQHGISVEVIDLRSLVPMDTEAILRSFRSTGRLFTVEENPRLVGWGAEVVSLVLEEAFGDAKAAPVRITTPHIPLPQARVLEASVIPNVERIVETIVRSLNGDRPRGA